MTHFTDTAVLPPLLATAVGSMPHTDTAAAVRLIAGALKTAPHCPQMSRADPREQMWIQYTEGIPRFRTDLENLSYSFDTSGDPTPDLEEFYTHFLEVEEGGSADHFAVGPVYGGGIHAFFEHLRAGGRKLPFVKVQATGPLSFALTVTDENRKPIFYHPLFRDVAVKAMGMKAVWLVDQAKQFAENVIVFFDEPSLSAYGSSAFLGVSKNDVVESLDEVISLVANRGGIVGVHCCGNTDWGILMETSTRIINFDAVDYVDTMAIYARELVQFLQRGGALAWGAVPNTEAVERESLNSVVERISEGVALLERHGLDRGALLDRLIVTPACGCAGLTVEQTEKVYQLLAEVDSLERLDATNPTDDLHLDRTERK